MQELNVIDTQYDTKQIHTPCRDCIFSLVDYKTQYDCATGMFERFRQNNINKSIVYDEDGNEFYVINGIQCPNFRDKKWKNKVDEKAESNVDLLECVRLVQEQNICRFYLMLFYNQLTSTPESLQEAINNCLTNKYQHTKYVFVCNDKSYGHVMTALRNSPLLNWRIETILEECNFMRAVDIAQKKAVGYQYSGIYVIGQSPVNFSLLQKISDSVFNFKNLALVRDNDGFIVYNKIYNMLGGNFDKPFTEKFNMLLEESKEYHLIKDGCEL